MGGPGSMTNWRRAGLANYDDVHLMGGGRMMLALSLGFRQEIELVTPVSKLKERFGGKPSRHRSVPRCIVERCFVSSRRLGSFRHFDGECLSGRRIVAVS